MLHITIVPKLDPNWDLKQKTMWGSLSTNHGSSQRPEDDAAGGCGWPTKLNLLQTKIHFWNHVLYFLGILIKTSVNDVQNQQETQNQGVFMDLVMIFFFELSLWFFVTFFVDVIDVFLMMFNSFLWTTSFSYDFHLVS